MNEIPLGLSFDDVLIVPKYSEVSSRSQVNTTTQFSGCNLQVPILSANMDTVTTAVMAKAMAMAGGIGVIHRNMSIEDQAMEVKEAATGNLAVGAAIGVSDTWETRLKAVIASGAVLIVLDIAHGHSKHAVEIANRISSHYPQVVLVAGNVATPEAVKDFADVGVRAVKVGIGPGAACTTRVMTGVGYPQFSAIMNCVEVGRNLGVSIIADGGVRNPGDIAKCVAAGADAVMIGGLLAGTDEAPGAITSDGNGNLFKSFRGMASAEASGRAHAEGVSGMVKYRGSVKNVVEYLMGGLRSAMSYVGATTIPEFQDKAEFVRVTNAGQIESAPHDMKVIGD